MPISRQQLETWSNQGATVTSTNTYASVKNALYHPKSLIKDLDFEVYLQGSYGNSTNIWGDSDVDVVVQLNQTFGPDLSSLTAYEAQLHKSAYSDATYLFSHFRADVIKTLQNYYGVVDVVPGNKSIKVKAGLGRLTADVIPSLHYRKYHSFFGTKPEEHSYTSGIKIIHTTDGREIINYPKLHLKHGESKNVVHTNGNYKATVRMFKNTRSNLADLGTIKKDAAPSYFVECLIYNAPHSLFTDDRYQTFTNIVNHFAALQNPQWATFMCQNGIHQLFGLTSEQWNIPAAQNFIASILYQYFYK